MTRSDVGRGHPQVLPGPGGTYCDADAEGLVREPVQQSGKSSGARDNDRARNLGADRTPTRCRRLRCRLRRNHYRADAVLFPRCPRRGNGPGRSGGFGAGRLRGTGPNRAKLVHGRSKGSARISSRRSPICRASNAPSGSATPRVCGVPATCSDEEGILAGSSSGTLVAAALKYCREQSEPKRVVTFACDSGNKYLSKMYNDFWMADRGFLTTPTVRRSPRPDRPPFCRRGGRQRLLRRIRWRTAYTRMRLYEVSQLPVLKDRKIVGIFDESDLLLAVTDNDDAFRQPVHQFMTTKLRTLSPSARLEDLLPIFDAGLVAIIADGRGVPRSHHTRGRCEFPAPATRRPETRNHHGRVEHDSDESVARGRDDCGGCPSDWTSPRGRSTRDRFPIRRPVRS